VVLPERTALLLPLSAELDPRLALALRTRGVQQIYSHQRAAWDAVTAGLHTVVVTPTASGKTLCYNLPVLQAVLKDRAKALYLFHRELPRLGIVSGRCAHREGDQLLGNGFHGEPSAFAISAKNHTRVARLTRSNEWAGSRVARTPQYCAHRFHWRHLSLPYEERGEIRWHLHSSC
jgi:hypothetical protein